MTAVLSPREATRPDRVELEVDVAAVTPWDGDAVMAVDVFLPRPVDNPPGVVLCCLAGGGVNRRYWDLDVEGDPEPTHSFGRYLSDAGFVVVTVDHLSVGESSAAPPLELTVEVLAECEHAAMTAVLDGIREGTIDDRLPAMPAAVAIGVGHSMGAMLTVIQQARHATYAGIALLGFANRGLPDFLPPDLAPFAGDQDALRAALPEILKNRPFPASRPREEPPADGEKPLRRNSPLFHGDRVPDRVVKAVRAIEAPAPPLAAMTSMVPGSIAREIETVSVPVLIANGDLDITGPIEEIAPRFTSSPAVQTLILPDTAHSHHAFPGRVVLWDGLAEWARNLASTQETR